jgi:hypothetical protein
LRDVGAIHFVTAAPTRVAQREAERSVGFVERLARHRERGAPIATHARELSALARKQEGFVHRHAGRLCALAIVRFVA